MAEILLSIGMIIKNEMRCLKRCLDSLTPLREQIPCQLVIADTGSTDGSRAVAEQYADVLIDFPWINDFAAARNAVLEQCTGVWYLTVDADEWLDADVSQLIAFLRSDESRSNDLARVIQRSYVNRDFTEYEDFFADRMGRMRGGKLRYAAPIHEYLTYTDRPIAKAIALPKVILYHDGYLNMTPGAVAAKRKRNMVLLRQELERDPTNLRTLKHCIDSAETPAERRRMVERTRRELEYQTQSSPSYAGMYQTCARTYWADEEFEELATCLGEWHRRLPDSALYRVDGEFLWVSLCYQKNQYAQALEHIQAYEAGIADVDSGADLHCPDRLTSLYTYAAPSSRQRMNTIRFHCLCCLGRFEEADAFLQDPSLMDMVPQQKGVLVLKVLEFWEHLGEAARFLRAVWDRAASDLAAARTGKQYDVCKIWADDLGAMFREHYEKHGAAVLSRFAQMEDRAPGCSARILLEDDPAAIQAEWDRIGDYQHLFPQVYLHCMERDLPFPEAFYQQTRETLAAIAAGLTKADGLRMARTVARWLAGQPLPETLGELVWQLDLVTAALRISGWDADTALGERLCGAFVALCGTYNENVWDKALLNQEDIRYLPAMQRCGWYCGRAMKCLNQGDELGYVRALRAALDAAPAMKEMVDFLLEHKPKTDAQRQLEELAGQVRAILARYASDDPAVAVLQQSPAYQKVAPLLEQQGPSAAVSQTAEAFLSPEALEEALAGSREEIAASVRQNLGRWGEQIARKRTDYWKKYPLWGADEAAVEGSLSAALSSHRTDFRWLFDRLADQQSRRVLTAIVRSWRFYEVEPLRQVREAVYDDYFDLTLLHCDGSEVVADLGAFTGDTFLSYVKNYGSLAYRRYYCYEVTKESFEVLKKVTASYPWVVLRRKGAGAGSGTMTLDTNSNASANTLRTGADSVSGESAEPVEIVALDDDITEPLTLIKMDIEGSEQKALSGCARHIREDRPKLVLSVYHNFEDIWKLPRMIEDLVPGYRFYLRYHGGDLWPSEITLLALPPV